MTNSQMTNRRTILKAGVAVATTIAAPLVITQRAEAEDNILYINTWGGTIEAAENATFYKSFTAKTGIQIRTVSPVSLAKLKAQIQTGNYEWDVTTLNLVDFYQAMSENLVEPLDFTVINKNNIPEGGIIENAITSVLQGTNLIYRKDRFPNGGPQSWADFWNIKKFPGKRGLYNQAVTALEFALLADGVPKDKLYPLDMDRAYKKLDEIKPHITVWWTQGNQSESLIRDGEVDMMSIWNGRGQTVIDQGSPVEMVWNEAHCDVNTYFAPRGTPRKKLAMQYLEHTIQAKPQGEFCNILPYGPSNPKAFDFMTKEAIAKSPTAPDHARLTFTPDAKWLTPRIAQIKDRFAQWLAA